MSKLKMDVYQDLCPVNPWDDEESIGFISTHKRYENQNTDIDPSIFSSEKDLENYLSENEYIFQKIYCLDHSGITIKASSENPFSCPWDSFLFGYLILSKNEVKNIYMTKRMSKKTITKAQSLLISFSESLNSFFQGDIYGFEITDENGDLVDSCYGIYGFENCEKEGQSSLNALLS